MPTFKFGGDGVTVWGAMSYRGTGFLTALKGNLNASGYIDILENSAIPSAHCLGYGDNFFLQDDGAPCHRSRIVETWKGEHDIRSIVWPPQSPDWNPIENLWQDLGKGTRLHHSKNLKDLERALFQTWDAIPMERCQTLVKSMPARIQAVIRARGGYTKY